MGVGTRDGGGQGLNFMALTGFVAKSAFFHLFIFFGRKIFLQVSVIKQDFFFLKSFTFDYNSQ